MENKEKIDVAIVGGGIMGLWCARTILKKFKNLSVVVFEAEAYLGEHTTGRNSEVLHSGIYYPTNSLKHHHCLRGNELWREYIKEKKISFLDSGKFIVSTKNQAQKLSELYTRAQENKVPGVRKLTSDEIKLLRREVNVDDGLYCPSSGVLNVSESLGNLRQEIESMGGIILTKSTAILVEYGSEKFLLRVNNDLIEATTLINTGGLFAVDFRKSLGLVDYENYFVKGSYLSLQKKLTSSKLIYPIPPANGLGLGVHLTLDTSGAQKFGPDTEEVEVINYRVEESLISKMLPVIAEVFKDIDARHLSLAYSGIRPKIKRGGAIVTDFVFQTEDNHSIKGYFEFLGIESPGITASVSLAEMLCSKF